MSPALLFAAPPSQHIQDYFACFRSFVALYQFYDSLSEESHWYFDENCTESIYLFEYTVIFSNVEPSNP